MNRQVLLNLKKALNFAEAGLELQTFNFVGKGNVLRRFNNR